MSANSRGTAGETIDWLVGGMLLGLGGKRELDFEEVFPFPCPGGGGAAGEGEADLSPNLSGGEA